MRKHRGLSAIVGTVFLVAVVIGALSYVTYSMNVLGNFSESLIVEEKRQKDQKEEAFEITSISVNQNKLNGIVKNTGEIPIRITNLYVDEQGVNDEVKKFSVNKDILPGNTINLLNSIDYTVDPAKGYNVKLVSSRGAVQTVYINSPSSESLLMNIRAVPEYVPSEFTTTILYSIVNNMSNNNVLYNVTPELTIDDVIGADVATLRSGPTPASYPVLAPGDVAIFEYIVKMTGAADDSAIFNATIANGVSGNFVTTTSTVREVTVATQAGTALESFGLSNMLGQQVDLMYFHDETDLTPGIEYQMDSADPAGGGTMVYPRSGNVEFLSASTFSPTTVINGTWNMRLSYWNDLTPVGVPTPSVAFHFNCFPCGGNDDISESTGNIDSDDLDRTGTVTLVSSGGPDDNAYYDFDGTDDYLDNEWDECTKYTAYTCIQSQAATTAVWFRIPPSTDNYNPIVRWGDDGNDDEYEISFGDGDAASHGNILFMYDTDFGNDRTKCESPSTYDYDDNLWHLAVGARSGDDDCKLYIDGVLVDDTEECIGCGGSSILDINGAGSLFIGFDGAGNELEGDVASFMHWDSTELNAGDILELYYTNYGNNATRLNWSIIRTNANGVNQETIYSGTHQLPFADPQIHSTSGGTRYDSLTNDNTFEKYSFYNATFTAVANATLNTGDRLKSVLSWPGDNQNLPINIRIDDDDPGFVLPDATSYIQLPSVSPALPSYTIIDNDAQVSYIVFNSGPNGAWFTYGGTRFVVTLPDGTASFAGIIDTVNGTAVLPTQDSIFIPDQNSAELVFEILANPPQLNAAANFRAPPGDYYASVFLSGFDDSGETFLRTIELGYVHIQE